MTNKQSVKGFLLLALAQITVGAGIVGAKYVVPTAPILFIIAMRFSFATLILFPMHWLTNARNTKLSEHFRKLDLRDWLYLLAQAFSAGVLFNSLMFAGLNYTDANVAGIITSALPAIIAVMAWLVLREKISKKQGFFVFLATLGLLVIAIDKFYKAKISHSYLGDLLVFLSLLPEASYYILCKLHTNRLPVFIVSALVNALNALVLFPLLFLINWQTVSIPPSTWFILAALGLGSGLFYVFWYLGSHKVAGVMASLSTAIMPIATVLFAWILLGEQLTIIQFVGMGLIVFSIVGYARS